ncbi:MAG: hypothetical protein WC076_13895 [Terrimicrobiaceae bacterium]
MTGIARFATHSHPVGLASGLGLMQQACSLQTGLLAVAALLLNELFAGLAIMGFELVELGVDFRQAAGVGRNEFVDFGLPHFAAVASHGECLGAKVLGRGPVNFLGLERKPVDPLGESRFSQGAIAAHLPHFADSVHFQRAKFPVIEIANLRL